MNIDESVFAFKLYELEEQYGKLQCRVRVCEEGGRDKIHSELQKAEDEFEENTLLLKEKVKSCRSGAVAMRKRRVCCMRNLPWTLPRCPCSRRSSLR